MDVRHLNVKTNYVVVSDSWHVPIRKDHLNIGELYTLRLSLTL